MSKGDFANNKRSYLAIDCDSICKRYLQNLQSQGIKNLIAFDAQEERLKIFVAAKKSTAKIVYRIRL